MRRLPALVLVIVVAAAVIVVGRTTPDRPASTFSERPDPWVPAVEIGSDDPRPTTWFCPGVPAGGDGRSGEVTIVNRSGRELSGRLSVLAAGDEPGSEQDVSIEPWESTTIDVSEGVEARFVSAVVELDDVSGLVEQRAVHPDGDASAPCTTEVSPQWYLADGFTVGGSRNQVVITNPYEEDAVIDLEIVTESGSRSPVSYQGRLIPAQSVRVVNLAPLGARNEEILAVHVSARGRVVVGRSQHFTGGGRAGYEMTLASPSLADQWWFAIGEHGEGIREEYRVYNPTDDDVEVTVVPLGVELPVPEADNNTDGESESESGDNHDEGGADGGSNTINVRSGSVAVVDTDDLPDGLHSMLFNTSVADERSIVVERVLTRTVDGQETTSVSLGLPRREEADLPLEWYVPRAPAEATEDALTLHNMNAATDVAVAIYRIGDDGFIPVPGLDSVTIRAGQTVTVDLAHQSVNGQPLAVTSSDRVLVERSMPRDGPLGGRTTVWPVPRADGPFPDGQPAEDPEPDSE